MSNKDKTVKVDKAIAQGIVPKLRFPEFRDAGEWEEKELGQVLVSVSNGLNLNQTNCKTGYKVTRIETISDKTINLNKVGYIQTDQDITSYKLCIGDILFSNINSVSHIGKVVIVDQDYDLYHGMNLLRLVANKELNDSHFLFYQLSTQKIKVSFEARANKAVNQASINQTELKKTIIVAPKLPEQQKIADCLSSLDELIAAQSQKLDTLKAHKKGLMQQLFPAEGETVPKLRFPEFRNAGEWKEIKLGKIVEILSGESPSKFEFIKSGIPYYKVEQLNDSDKYLINSTYNIKKTIKIAKKGSLIFPKRGASILLNKIRILSSDSYMDTNLMSLIPNNNIDNEFLYYFILHVDLSKIADTTSIPQINNKHINPYIIYLPSHSEQQKIANCLSSIDELIASHSQKLNTLNAHKKGLMQQLFPSIDEVHG